MSEKSRKKTALVIGSGGIKCAAAIGLWRVLEAEGIPIDLIVGCSGGSMYGALIANGDGPEQMEEYSRLLWTNEIMQGYVSNLKASKDGSLKFNERSGLVDDSVINERLEKAFGGVSFSDFKIPFKAVATDLMSGEKVTLEEGNVLDAIRASIALPIIFPPWEVDGRLLIDGAASDPLPLDVAIQEGADVIIAMGFTLSYRGKTRSMTAVQEQMNSIYMNNILRSTYAFYNLAHHAEIFPVMPEFEEPLGMFDTDKLEEIIEVGEKTASEQMPYIKRFLSE